MSTARMHRLIAACALFTLLAGCAREGKDWDPHAAASYLDRRAQHWMTWKPAALENGTACVSCHTTLPYALARPQLATLLREAGPPAPEQKLLAEVRQRVKGGSLFNPYYKDAAIPSRSVEGVLNALILANEDARHGVLTDGTLLALNEMWELQLGTGPEAGSWPWMQFSNEPWEGPDSAYYGTTLAAIAVARAPQGYALRPSVQGHIALLRDYLTREAAQQQPLSRLELLWSSQQLAGLLDTSAQQEIADEIWSLQRADGGWSLRSLMPRWQRNDGTAWNDSSDAFATGFATLVLQSREPAPPTAPRLQHALAWLREHQSAWSGAWSSESPNRERRFWREPHHFMDDAATAFAAMALSTADTRADRGIAAVSENAAPTNKSRRDDHSLAAALVSKETTRR